LNGGFNLKSIKIEGTNTNPLPDNYSIWNYPNPFNTETTFYFSDNIESDGQLTIYDNSGHVVQNIVIEQNQSSVTWDGKDRYGLATGSGIYIYQVKFDQQKIAGKMTLIR
jgi:flagellar hook assembly protein FlgD